MAACLLCLIECFPPGTVGWGPSHAAKAYDLPVIFPGTQGSAAFEHLFEEDFIDVPAEEEPGFVIHFGDAGVRDLEEFHFAVRQEGNRPGILGLDESLQPRDRAHLVVDVAIGVPETRALNENFSRPDQIAPIRDIAAPVKIFPVFEGHLYRGNVLDDPLELLRAEALEKFRVLQEGNEAVRHTCISFAIRNVS